MTKNWWGSFLYLSIISCLLIYGCKSTPTIENSNTALQQIPNENQAEEQDSTEVSQPFIEAGQIVFDMEEHGDDGLGILFQQDSDVEEILIDEDSTGEVWCSRTGNGQVLPSSDGNAEADSYLRFDIGNGILFQIPEGIEIQIEIEYLDKGYDTFRLEYDAHSGGPNGDGNYTPTEMIEKTDSGEFKTAVFTLYDAYFGNRIQDNADFRIDDLKDGAETIWRVTVKWNASGNEGISENDQDEEQINTIFYNGNIITMNEGQPIAHALAVKDGFIEAVGSDDEILALSDGKYKLVDLGGKTLMPGFIDTHNHLLEAHEKNFMEEQDLILANGITTIGILYSTQEWIDELGAFDQQSGLKVRTNLYLTYSDACGEVYGDWYTDHSPTQDKSKMLRIAGVKVYADGGACNSPAVSFEYPEGGNGDLYFTQEEMNQIVKDINNNGFQAAIHALGDRAAEQVLNAIESANVDGVNIMRNRIEHNTLIRDDMLGRHDESGAVATIFGSYPTCYLSGELENIKSNTPEDFKHTEWRWKDLITSNPNTVFAWHTDVSTVDGPKALGIFVLNPIKSLNGFVTRREITSDGSGCEPREWMLENTISVEQALPIMTINGAYALKMDDVIGSLEPGKFGDVVILSDDPLTVAPGALNDIEVLMTMVNGKAEFCAPGHLEFCSDEKISDPSNPVEGWAVLAVKEDYTEVGMHSNLTDYIDLDRMRDALISSGWDPNHIHESREFDRDSLQADLDWLEVSADKNDVVVFYLSAHSTYLINNLNWDDFFSEEWEQIPSHKRLLIADLCNGGYFTYPTNNDPNPHLSIASADSDELSWKCEVEEGFPIVGMIFTKYFVDALSDLNYDTDGDGYVSVQEAALIAEEQQRSFMHEYIFSNPDYLTAFENYGNFPNSDPTFPDVILDDTIGEPLYLILDAYK